ncbi:hypothetical protein NXH76_05160 [Blautia schinkii]|nr:hypothetical protein [Blautia schinkii]
MSAKQKRYFTKQISSGVRDKRFGGGGNVEVGKEQAAGGRGKRQTCQADFA